MENYQNYDDEVEDDPGLELDDVDQIHTDAFDEIVKNEENDQVEDILNEISDETRASQDSVADEQGDQPRRSERVKKSNRIPEFIYALRKLDEIAKSEDQLVTTLNRICGLVEEAAIQGEKGKRAAAKIELERVWKKYGAIMPAKFDRKLAKEIIKGKLFVTEKKNSSHIFTRNKGRLVARGDMRKNKPRDIHDVFSPTVAFPTFLTLLNIVLNKRYQYITGDVESAYLNSDYAEGIFMKLDPEVAAIMVEMDESVKQYLEPDGSIYVKIVKALYGLQESAKLWYETLGRTLARMGFTRSNYDHACYFMRKGNDLAVILIYVDDMFIIGREADLKQVKEGLAREYAMNFSEMSPKEFDYVGIKVEYSVEDNAFSVSQPGMVRKIIDGVNEISDVPCDVKLYQETDATKLENVTDYRSKLMEMNYLSKTRPDIKVALGYLATKMQEPTKGDENKLFRLKRYIKGLKI